jgi:hypothetical protein
MLVDIVEVYSFLGMAESRESSPPANSVVQAAIPVER